MASINATERGVAYLPASLMEVGVASMPAVHLKGCAAFESQLSLCPSSQVKEAWLVSLSLGEVGVAFAFQIKLRSCGLCPSVPGKEVWPVSISPREGGVA